MVKVERIKEVGYIRKINNQTVEAHYSGIINYVSPAFGNHFMVFSSALNQIKWVDELDAAKKLHQQLQKLTHTNLNASYPKELGEVFKKVDVIK